MKALVLLSGGMDSAVALAAAKAKGRRVFALGFDYGQGHAQELTAARWQAKAQGAEGFRVFKLPLGDLASGALLHGKVNQQGLRPGKPSTYVSFRNGVLLALAASHAEALGATELWGGWCKTDLGGYPDCSLAFFRAFERAVHAGTWAGRQGQRLRIQAPLARLDKAGILKLGLRLGVDFGHTWTCYKPLRVTRDASRPCSKCDACRLRAQGFVDLGGADPLLKLKGKP